MKDDGEAIKRMGIFRINLNCLKIVLFSLFYSHGFLAKYSQIYIGLRVILI